MHTTVGPREPVPSAAAPPFMQPGEVHDGSRHEGGPPRARFAFRLPEGVLDIPFRHEQHRLLRFEAALLIDLHLRRLSRVTGAIDRAVAHRLRRLRGARGYIRLGFARFADYARERLGVSVRTAQEWARLGEALDRLPALDRALGDGRVTWSAAVQVARVAGAGDEAEWVGLAERLPVRELRERVARFLGGRGDAPPVGTDDEAGATRPDPEPAASTSDETILRCTVEAPRGTALLWNAALDLCTLVAGEDLPETDRTEYVLAELLSALPATGDESTGDEPAGPPSRRNRGPWEFGGWRRFRHGRTPHTLHDSPAAELGPRDLPPPYSTETRDALALLDLPLGADPFELDAGARALLRARSALDLDLARLLRLFHSFSLHEHVGFRTFADYAEERLHVSVPRARWLIRLDHKLFYFPAVARAVRDGRFGGAAALLVCRVAGSGPSAAAWIDHAEHRTVLRLREEVTYSERHHRLLNRTGGTSLPPSAGRLPSMLDTLTTELSRGVQHECETPARGGEAVALRVEHAGCETSAHRSGPEALREALVDVTERHASGPNVRIALTLGPSSTALWAAARRRIAAATGCAHIPDSAILLAAAVEFLVTYLPTWFEVLDHGDAIALRERFRCAIPGCSIHGGSAHHLIPRSRLGPDEPWNLLFLCYTHHIESAHRGRLRVEGRAPDDLIFELGIRPDGTPLQRFVNQERQPAPEAPLPFVEFVVTDAPLRPAAAAV